MKLTKIRCFNLSPEAHYFDKLTVVMFKGRLMFFVSRKNEQLCFAVYDGSIGLTCSNRERGVMLGKGIPEFLNNDNVKACDVASYGGLNGFELLQVRPVSLFWPPSWKNRNINKS